MTLLAQLLQTPVREKAGAETVNRFEFQTAWGLLHLLELYDSGTDYAVAFEFHDDIIVLDSATDPKKVRFHQVKSRKDGKWTLAGLTKREAGADGPKPSIIGKLLEHHRAFRDATEHLAIVSNQACAFLDHDKNLCCFAEADKEDFTAFIGKLKEECGEGAETAGALFHFRRTELPLRNFETYLTGRLAEFVEKHCGQIDYNVMGLYRTVTDECRRRTTRDHGTCQSGEIVAAKFVRRSDVSHWLKELQRRAARRPDWMEVVHDMGELSAARKLALRDQWRLYESKRFETANTQHAMLREMLRTEIDRHRLNWAGNLMEVVEAVLQEVRGRASHLDPAFGDDYIRAATTYEIYADDPGRKIQDAHTQYQEETA